MFGIGGTELFIILLFGFLIFGPDKLPGMGRTIGRVIRQFRNAQDEMNKVIKTEVYDPVMDNDPLKNPFDKSKGAKKTSNSAKSVEREETFAERKARLTREKEAARAATSQAAPKTRAVKTATAGASGSATAPSAKPADAPGKEGGAGR